MIDHVLRDLLVCPLCRSSLSLSGAALTCRAEGCGQTYSIVDGIPRMASDRFLDAFKREQAHFFDIQDSEFETCRPHGSPSLYQWLMTRKLARSISAFRTEDWRGRVVLVVCGGSGMEAEYLAGLGAVVISVDVSIEAANRAKERSRRFGVSLYPVVADVERLPFADRAVHTAYVHDGLHHLENPETGLMEMTRVAASGLCLTEPADAAITKIAVRLGVAEEKEEAGNSVQRLRLDALRDQLDASGFQVVGERRYFMFYRHTPGRLCRLLSAPVLLQLAKSWWVIATLVSGRFGNKLTLQAVRR